MAALWKILLHLLDELVQVLLELFDPERTPAIEVPETAAHDDDVDLGAVVVGLEVVEPVLQVFAPDASDKQKVDVDIIVFPGAAIGTSF
jgi:hypothetical protein